MAVERQWRERFDDLAAHLEDEVRRPERGRFSYDMRTHCYYYMTALGRMRIVPLALFEETRAAYMHAEHCNYQQATEVLLNFWRWDFTVCPPRYRPVEE